MEPIQDDRRERCEVCREPMHRYGFPADGLAGGGRSHEPTAIACVNGIIGELDRAVAKEDPDAREHVWQQATTTLTFLGAALDRLVAERDRLLEKVTRHHAVGTPAVTAADWGKQCPICTEVNR